MCVSILYIYTLIHDFWAEILGADDFVIQFFSDLEKKLMIHVLYVTSQPQQDWRKQPVIKHRNISAAKAMNIHTERGHVIMIINNLPSVQVGLRAGRQRFEELIFRTFQRQAWLMRG